MKSISSIFGINNGGNKCWESFLIEEMSDDAESGEQTKKIPLVVRQQINISGITALRENPFVLLTQLGSPY